MLTEAQRSPVWTSVFKPQQYFSLWGSSLKVCVCVCEHACVHRNPSVTLLESSFHIFLLRTEQSRQDTGQRGLQAPVPSGFCH